MEDVVDVVLHTMVEAPTLSSEEKESLEELVSEEEALAVLKRMNNQKSPGSDGFTTEFYKFFFWKDMFWSDLLTVVLDHRKCQSHKKRE